MCIIAAEVITASKELKIIAAFLLAFGTPRENRLHILFLEGNQMTTEKLCILGYV